MTSLTLLIVFKVMEHTVERICLRKVYNLRSIAFAQIIACTHKLKLYSEICALMII